MFKISGKTIYFDCSAGVSGDMFVGALLDIGANREKLLSAIKSLKLDDFDISIEKVRKSGILASKFNVVLCKHVHVHRHFSDIKKIIDDSGLSNYSKSLATKIFEIAARAEGKVHGLPPEEVCFHEVGAADSIADIVSAAVCLEDIEPNRIICSPLNVGGGNVRCAHGILPVPAPATAEILCEAKIPFMMGLPEEGELVTPTGAAILAAVCSEYGAMPLMTLERVGCGAGAKELSRPNVLRAFLGCSYSKVGTDTIEIIETNIDDTSGEALGKCLDELMHEGAVDAYFTPIYMKKMRPAFMLTVMCEKDFVRRAAQIIFERTGSIGLRIRTSERIVMQRKIKIIKTRYGEIPVKFSTFDGVKKYKAESEYVEKAAKKFNVPPSKIYGEVISIIESDL